MFFGSHKPFSKTWRIYVSCFFVVGASHGVLDAFTDGGLGIALFSPFDSTRYFFPCRPLLVSPIGLKAFLSDWGVRVLITEVIYVWLPFLVLVVTVRVIRRRSSNRWVLMITRALFHPGKSATHISFVKARTSVFVAILGAGRQLAHA